MSAVQRDRASTLCEIKYKIRKFLTTHLGDVIGSHHNKKQLDRSRRFDRTLTSKRLTDKDTRHHKYRGSIAQQEQKWGRELVCDLHAGICYDKPLNQFQKTTIFPGKVMQTA